MKNLIEKYFQGETSLEEEARLRDYFSSGKVDESLRQYQPLFGFFETEKRHSPGGDFDEKLLTRIDGEAKVIRLRPMRRFLQVAAVAAMLMVGYLFLQPKPEVQQQAIDWAKYEITDEQVAFEKTKAALQLLSSKLNKSKKKAVEEVGKTEKVAKYFK